MLALVINVRCHLPENIPFSQVYAVAAAVGPGGLSSRPLLLESTSRVYLELGPLERLHEMRWPKQKAGTEAEESSEHSESFLLRNAMGLCLQPAWEPCVFLLALG